MAKKITMVLNDIVVEKLDKVFKELINVYNQEGIDPVGNSDDYVWLIKRFMFESLRCYGITDLNDGTWEFNEIQFKYMIDKRTEEYKQMYANKEKLRYKKSDVSY